VKAGPDTLWLLMLALAAAALLLLLGVVLAQSKARLRLPKIPGRARVSAAMAWLSQTLRRAFRFVGSAFTALARQRDLAYRAPRVLVVGDVHGGRSALVAASPGGEAAALDVLAGKTLHLDGTLFQINVENDHIDGLPASVAGNTTLARLEELRPERPADGVIITLSAKTLQTASARERKELGRNLSASLFAIQERLEVALPVYLLVTRLDGLPGFGPFLRLSRDETAEDRTFGWASPYAPDAGFTADWIGDAFAAAEARLLTMQRRALKGRYTSGEALDGMIFPHYFAELDRPLRDVAESLYEMGAYPRRALVRGIFFTAEQDGQALFFREVLHGKIFAERTLGRPLSSPWLSRNDVLRKVQWASALGIAVLCVLLGLGAGRLSRQIESQRYQLAQLTTLTQTQKDGGTVLTPKELSGVLSGLGKVGEARAGFGGLDEQQRAVVRGALESLVFPAVRKGLLAKATAYQKRVTQPVVAPQGLNAARTEFTVALEDLAELERERLLYNSLQSSEPGTVREASMILDLARRVFGQELAVDGDLPPGVLDSVLAEVWLKPPLEFSDAFRGAVTVALATRASHLAGLLVDAVKPPLTACSGVLMEATSEAEELRRLPEWTASIQNDWDGATLEQNPCADAAREISRTCASLSAIGYPPESLARLESTFEAKSCFDRVSQTLRAVTFPRCGMLMGAERDALLVRETCKTELSDLAMLASQNFMLAEMPVATPAPGSSMPRLWDGAPLGDAADVLVNLETFERALTSDRDAGIAPSCAKTLGRRRATRLVAAHVMRAQTLPKTTPTADMESQRFAAATPRSQTLRTLALQLGFDASLEPWLSSFTEYAQKKLEEMGLSNPGAFFPLGARTGPNGVRSTFASSGEAAGAFESELSRVRALAHRAQPYLSWLNDVGAPGATQRSATDSTLAELTKYDAGDKSSTVNALADLYVGKLGTLEQASCASWPSGVAAKGIDLFSVRYAQLTSAVDGLCREETQLAVGRTYNTFAADFRATLCGKFPFDVGAETVCPGRSGSDAQVADVRRLADALPAVQASLKGAVLPHGGVDQQTFLTNLARCIDFLQQFTEPSKPAKVKLSFRANTFARDGTTELVRWGFAVGDDEAYFPNGPTELTWGVYAPVSVSFRWASMSAYRPTTARTSSNVVVQGPLATVSYSGVWPLLRLLRDRSSEGTASATSLVTVRIPTEFRPQAQDGSSSRPAFETVASTRLTLVGADGTTLVMPTCPAIAPKLQERGIL
jgi:type VI secretion system protein ImpL